MEKPKFHHLKDWLKVFFCGLFVGVADLIPGISGGTVAFMLGIYTDLLNSIKTLNGHAIKLLITFRWISFFRQVAWEYVLTIYCGVFISLLAFSGIVLKLLNQAHSHQYLYAAFMGLILASIFLCWRRISSFGRREFFAVLLGATLAYLGTGTNIPAESDELYDVPYPLSALPKPVQSLELINYDKGRQALVQIKGRELAAMHSRGLVHGDTLVYSHRRRQEESVKSLPVQTSHSSFFINPWTVFCGVLGAFAMLLPGISGSYVLLLLGMYPQVIEALTELSKGMAQLFFPLEALTLLGNLALGIVIGYALCSRFVSWLLTHHHDIGIALLTGFMIGSLHVLWPFWEHAYLLNPLKSFNGIELKLLNPVVPDLFSASFVISLTAMLTGFFLVSLAERIASSRNQITR